MRACNLRMGSKTEPLCVSSLVLPAEDDPLPESAPARGLLQGREGLEDGEWRDVSAGRGHSPSDYKHRISGDRTARTRRVHAVVRADSGLSSKFEASGGTSAVGWPRPSSIARAFDEQTRDIQQRPTAFGAKAA